MNEWMNEYNAFYMNEWIQNNAFFMNEWMNEWMNTYNAFFMNEWLQYYEWINKIFIYIYYEKIYFLYFL